MGEGASNTRYIAIVLVAVLLGGTIAVLGGHQRAEATGGLEVQEIEIPFDWVDATQVAAINDDTSRMYVYFFVGVDSYIAEYDLATAEPTLLRVSDPNVSTAGLHSLNRDLVDTSRDRLLVINTSGTGNTTAIDVIDLETLEQTASWNVTSTVPGFNPTGFTYDEEVDRLHLVGEFTATTNVRSSFDLSGTAFRPGPAVVALDATTGEFVWAMPLEGCDGVLDNNRAGAMIGQSVYRPALYVFCVGGGAAFQPVSSNALIRVDITGHGSTSGLGDFPTEVFPVSGTYVGRKTGIATFDAVSERVFVQSQSDRTPGAWVFDGLKSAWVGFIAAPDDNNLWSGLNPKNGRYYMGGSFGDPAQAGYVNVADGRSTPVAQGSLFEDVQVDGHIFADPSSNRVFQAADVPNNDPESPFSFRKTMLMVRDNTDPIVPLPPQDLDSLTEDLPDEEALLQYSARAEGFGARYVAVGGWETLYSRLRTQAGFGNFPVDRPANPTGLAFGDRGLTLAEVPGVDIRPGGAAAATAVSSIDEATASDRNDAEREAGGALGSEDGGPIGETSAQVFPFRRLTCLDGVGERVEDSDDGGSIPGSASVVCDLAELRATGNAEYSGDIGAGGVSISRSTFDTDTFRDADRGVVSETTATAEGITLALPGVGTLAIDRVTTTATTVANGRPDTASSSWERVVEGVTLEDADGQKQQLESCTTTIEPGKDPEPDGSCDDLAATISGLSPRVDVRMPVAEVEATPLGAFAGVAEPQDEFLNGQTMNNDRSAAVPGMEIVVYNDGPEKGRLLVQLAAIDANSTFTRSPAWMAPTSDPADDGSVTGNEGTASSGTGSTTEQGSGTTTPTAGIAPGSTVPATSSSGTGDPAPAVAAPAPGVPAGTTPVASGWLPTIRNFGDGALAGGLYGLFALPMVEAFRRRKLLALLNGPAA